MKYLVKFTFWSDEKDVRTIWAQNCHVLQGILVGLSENEDVELLNVEVINDK